MKAKLLKKIFLISTMVSGLTFAHAFADSLNFDFYASDPLINIEINKIQPYGSEYIRTTQASNALLSQINFSGNYVEASNLANEFATSYPNHIGLNTTNSNPDPVDVYVGINMSINGSYVLTSAPYNAIALAHEHKSNHNWFIAASAGTIFAGVNKNHSDWGLNVTTQDGNQYCLKAVNLADAVVVYKGQCNNDSNYSSTDIGANSSGRYDFSHKGIRTFTFSPNSSISKIAFTYNGTHDGIFCISNCSNYSESSSMTERFANIYSTTSGNQLKVNILSNLSTDSGTNYVPVSSFNFTFPGSQQFSDKYYFNSKGNDDTYPGLVEATYFVVNGNLAITDNNNVTTTFPISLAYSGNYFAWNIGSAMGNSVHNRKMTLTNNGISYCLTGNYSSGSNNSGSSAIVSSGACSN